MNAVRRDHERLLNNLRILQKTHSVAELADVIGVSKVTWHNRMKEPWRAFSYDDFRAIAQYCKVDLMQIISGEIRVQ